MQFGEPVTGFEAEIKEAISYFEFLPKKYTEDEKAHRKIRYSAYFNLAKIYSLLDNPAKSNEYCQKLIDNDYDKQDGVSMMKENDETLTLSKLINSLQGIFLLRQKIILSKKNDQFIQEAKVKAKQQVLLTA